MSSFTGSQLPGSENLPPESAQAPPSLFGGPSSDVLQPSSQPERPRRSLFGGPAAHHGTLDTVPESDLMDEAPDQVEDEFDMIMRERPLAPDYDSNGESFQGSPPRGRKRSKRNQNFKYLQSSPPIESSQGAAEATPEPIRYVVDRGLDLPPGTERPNLFQGASSSWREYNADDIGACSAMITERSRDLAAHLYNAYAIRRRTRDPLGNDADTNENASFTVPRRWTAWPVPAALVPRLGELLRKRMHEAGFMHMAPDPRPSADLEESITALLLKISKDKYRAREWDYEDIKSELDRKITDENEMMGEELEKKEYGESMLTAIMRPIIQADDDKSTKQLRPLARNVITQVDKLLYGLHCAMKGRKYEEESGAEQSSSEEEEEEHQSPRKPKGGSRSRSRGRKVSRNNSPRKQAAARSVSARASTIPETENQTRPDASRTRSQSHDSSESHDGNHYIKGRLRLRDWSEVIGLASMMDLPQAAVMRASKRCADLFGEDMQFHTMSEGRVKKKRNHDGQWVYTYTESETEGESVPPTPQPKSRPSSQPKATAKRPYKQRSKQAQTPNLVPPSVSNSPVSQAVMDREQTPVRQPKKSRPGLGKGAHRKVDIICPLADCSRHTKGFSRTWNLNQHMKKAHPSYVTPMGHELNDRATDTPEEESLIDVD